jgi:hypothetical protein
MSHDHFPGFQDLFSDMKSPKHQKSWQASTTLDNLSKKKPNQAIQGVCVCGVYK